jgi:hypothetical protein
MPESGQSWQRAFPAEAAQARAARAWIAAHTRHVDAPLVCGELFLAALSVQPAAVHMTLSSAGARSRITAGADKPLPLRALHGPGRVIVAALSTRHGVTVDDCGVWAELPWEAP